MSSLTEPVAGPRTTTYPLLQRLAVRPSRLQSNLNLTRELAVTAFKLKYADSLLGYLWSLIKPLMIFGMTYLVFAVFLLRGRTSPLENYPVELLLGIVVWTFFAEASTASLFAIVANADMIKKAYFPRWILVVGSAVSAGMTLAVNFGLMLIIGLPLHWYNLGFQTLWLVPLFLELYVVTLGMGFVLSALYVFYRDLSHIWEVLLQFLFYTSAIIFPFSIIPRVYQPFAALNPMAQVVEDMRHVLVSRAAPWSSDIVGGLLVVPILIACGSLLFGRLIFRRLSRRFGERL